MALNGLLSSGKGDECVLARLFFRQFVAFVLASETLLCDGRLFAGGMALAVAVDSFGGGRGGGTLGGISSDETLVSLS